MATVIYSEKLNNYEPVLWRRQLVYTRFSQLYNYLSQNLGKEYADFFAQPHISNAAAKGFSAAKWSSTVFSKNAQLISALPANEQQRYRDLCEQKIAYIREFAERLLASKNSDKKSWGELLTAALTMPDDEHILVENDDVILVVWGFKKVAQKTVNSRVSETIRRKTPPVKNIASPDEKNKTDEEEKTEEDNDTIDETVNTDNNNRDEDDKGKVVDNEGFNNEKDEVANNTEEHKEDGENKKNDEENSKLEDKNKPVEEETENPPKDENSQKSEDDTTKKEPEDEEPEKPKKSWWKGNKRWILPLLVLLILAAILCAIFCRNTNVQLPPTPNIPVPIDTAKVGLDKDSVRVIATDRINIALHGENKNIQQFANEFKKAYPDDNYKVIYYDTLTYRIQVQVPENKREEVKAELKRNFKNFEMLIWDESMVRSHTLVPSDPEFKNPAHCWYHRQVKAFEAWDISQGDNSLVVAIIDNGFDLSHPELKDRIYKPWNVVTHSSNVNSHFNLEHGTHVAGIALGAADNSVGVSGIAPKCRFMPIQVGSANGQMSYTAIIDGVLYAIQNGANVVNMSLGMAFAPQVALLPPQKQEEMIRRMYKPEEIFWNELFQVAYDKNVIFVLAAGNDNIMIGIDPMQRSDKTIKVSALDQLNTKARFSNYGSKSTISAPGVGIYSSVPHGKFRNMDGTSMAAPIVTGGIALIKSINPALNYDEIVDLIQSTGKPVYSTSGEVGNLIQLDVVANIADKNRRKQPSVDCPEMQRKIDSLLQEIEKIRRLCPDTAKKDTLIIPPDADNTNFAIGRWKSTSYLYNQAGTKITLYFDFYKNGKGKITLQEIDNTQFTAPLSMNMKSGKFIIHQLKPASSLTSSDKYNPYYFECTPDKTGKAVCWAKNKINKSNIIKFNLIKIR